MEIEVTNELNMSLSPLMMELIKSLSLVGFPIAASWFAHRLEEVRNSEQDLDP
jgi:hypothetical protein